MWSQKSDGNSPGSSSGGISRLGRPGSGRSSEQRNGPGQQYNAWDRAARPGSGRGAAGDRNSATSPGASVSSTSSPSLSPTSPSSGGGLVPEHRIRPLPGGLNLVPGRMCNTASCLTSPEQAERRQSLKISFSQSNIMKRSVSMGLNFPGFSQAAAASAKVASENRFQFFNSVYSTGKLKIDSSEYDFKAEDLLDLGEIGRGAFGTVNKMLFQKANKVMAVKRIRSTVDEREQKELMDLDVVMKSSDCPYIVTFFGAIFKEGDCWICMELMATSLDKLYKFVFEYLNESIPEQILGQITLATLKALIYLKEQLKIIHRDVKPSNILSDRRGNIKLCDFGISGQLVDSIAKTRDAGCRPYMAPERIDPQRAKGYDIRSDVWSLGITLIEVATGRFPYPKWNSVFEQLQQVVHGDPPSLDPRENGKNFSFEFVNFVNTCLIKDEVQRPKYNRLLEHPFIRRSVSEADSVNVADYINRIVDQWDTIPAAEGGEGSFMDCTSSWSTNQ